MKLLRKSTLETNRMVRFENLVLLGFSFTNTESYILGKIIPSQGIFQLPQSALLSLLLKYF